MKHPAGSAFDVLVIDATGESGAQANALRRELIARGLRVKVSAIPPPSVSPTPAELFADAAGARYCVLFMPIVEDGRTEIAYIAVPAPTKPGQEPVFKAAGSAGSAGAVEVGRLRGDVYELAARVAARLGANGPGAGEA